MKLLDSTLIFEHGDGNEAVQMSRYYEITSVIKNELL